MPKACSQSCREQAGENHILVAGKASKRPLTYASVGQILDDDLRRESKKAKKLAEDDVISLEYNAPFALKPNMIPKSLRDRLPAAIRVVGGH